MTTTPAQRKRTPKLTDKQQRFVDLYCGADGGKALLNASKAVLLAGYQTKNPGDVGYQLRKNPLIRARIEEYIGSSAISRDEAVLLLADDARRSDRDILDTATMTGGPASEAATISSLFSARTTARTNFAKLHGLLTDNVHVDGEFPVLRILRMGEED
jgi:phage terminase small subunit